MKPKVKTVLHSLIISIISTAIVYAQKPAKNQKHSSMENIHTIYGKVTQFTANDNYVIDGFTLTSPTGNYNIKFPSYMGRKVISNIKTGNALSVSGYNDTRHGEPIFRLHSIFHGNIAIHDLPPAVVMPATRTYVKVSGKIRNYNKDREGKVNGFVLNNKTIVQFVPDLGSKVVNAVPPGSQVSIEGLQRLLPEGEVQLEKYDIIGASVISTNEEEYLVR